MGPSSSSHFRPSPCGVKGQTQGASESTADCMRFSTSFCGVTDHSERRGPSFPGAGRCQKSKHESSSHEAELGSLFPREPLGAFSPGHSLEDQVRAQSLSRCRRPEGTLFASTCISQVACGRVPTQGIPKACRRGSQLFVAVVNVHYSRQEMGH